MSKKIISDKELKSRLESLISEISLLNFQIANDNSKYDLQRSLSSINKLIQLELDSINLQK